MDVVAEIELSGVSVELSAGRVLDGVSFAVPDGSVAVLVGGSGAGKTSVLRAIAGLDPLRSGSVRFDGQNMADVEPGDRDVAVAFQIPTLYSNRSVGKNIAFPLEMRRQTADEIRDRVGAEVRVLGLEDLLERDVDTLSAGEAQMVQLARLLVRRPTVLMLDEPFARLDATLADRLRREVMLVQRGFGVTTLMTSNDPAEAMAMADMLVVLEAGRVTQVGHPLDVYERPETVAAAQLTGDASVMRVKIRSDGEGFWLEHSAFRVRAWQPALRRHAGRYLDLVTRPEWWEFDPRGTIRGEVSGVSRFASTASVVCQIGDEQVPVSQPDANLAAGLQPGTTVNLRLASWVLIDPSSGQRLDLA